MDVTPQLIEQIDFSEKFRGYDPDQVDDFLERVGTTLATLQAQAAELQARAERAEAEARTLRDQPPPAPAPAPAAPRISEEEAAAEATRTLILAQRTADAAVSEARQEAQQLLSEARARAEADTRDAAAEAERLVRDANSQRDDFLRRAREEAESEVVEQRDRLTAEIATLEERKAGLSGDVSLLEDRLTDYRSSLEKVHGAIRTVLDDPESLRQRDPLALATPIAATPPPAAADPGPEGTGAAPAASPFYPTGSNPVVSSGEAVNLTGQHERVTPDQVSIADPGDAPSASGSGDPWAPGSWSEVSSALEEPPGGDKLFETPPADEAGPSPFDAPAGDVFEPARPVEAVRADVRTEATAATGGNVSAADRYLVELDHAVNKDGDDEAMTAFFEGNEGRGERRGFGRRR